MRFNITPEERMLENILHGLPSDKKIYRVVSIDRFFEMINKKKLVLVKPDKWEDPFEDFLSQTIFINSKGQETGFNLTRDFFGQCWTLKSECDGIWRNYASLKDGVRIGTTVKKLLEVIYDKDKPNSKLSSFIGKVKYQTDKNIIQFLENDGFIFWLTDSTGKNIAKTLLIKRKEYSYEMEVRLLFSDEQNKSSNKSIVEFDIDALKLFDSILFAPKTSSNLFKEYKDTLIKKGFKKDKIAISKLYDPYKIIIKSDAL